MLLLPAADDDDDDDDDGAADAEEEDEDPLVVDPPPRSLLTVIVRPPMVEPFMPAAKSEWLDGAGRVRGPGRLTDCGIGAALSGERYDCVALGTAGAGRGHIGVLDATKLAEHVLDLLP
jgi:hypothetical protein